MNDKQLMAILKMKDEMSKTIKTVNRNLKDMKKHQQMAEDANNSLTKTIKANSKAMLKAGATITAVFGTIAFTAVKDATSFESAFTGVLKTMDLTVSEADSMRKSILDMSTEIPTTAEEIAKVFEIGGQLGIAKENIKDFSRVILDLAETTNIAGEEGALMIAKFANITNMNPKDYQRFGSTIVDLGNNLATTENDIVSLASRIAGAGATAGYSVTEILGIAGAVSSLGIEAEMGGTAVSKIMSKISVATSSASKAGQKYAKVAGMTAKEFNAIAKNNPSQAFYAFINGLSNVNKNGGNLLAVLDDLGFKESRLKDTVLRLAKNPALLAESLKLSSSAWEENIALVKEAELRYGTTESSMAIMRNEIRYASIEIGTAMLPIVRDLAEAIGGLASKFNALSPEQKEMISKIILGGLAVGILISVLGALGLALTGIGVVMTFLCSPIGLILLGIAALILAVINVKNAWDTNWNGIKDKTLEVVENVKEWWQGLMDFLSDPITATVNFVKKGVSNLVQTSKDARSGKINMGAKAPRDAFGSGRIARNDEIRRLHEGEKILTKREANDYERGLGNTNGITINVNGLTVREEADIDRIGNALLRKINQGRIVTGGVLG